MLDFEASVRGMLEDFKIDKIKTISPSDSFKKHVFFTSSNDEIKKTKDSVLWGRVFDHHYQGFSNNSDGVFNTDIWKSSYTGQTIPKEEMNEWIESSLTRLRPILKNRPTVLEIGCGNGLIFSSVIKYVKKYSGLDCAPGGLDAIRSSQLYTEFKEIVDLYKLEAVDLNVLPEEKFDLIILNSVIQYFSDLSYVIDFFKKLERVCHDNSLIFIGDVRSLELRDTFYNEVIKRKGLADDYQFSEILEKYRQRENESLFHRDFFKSLPNLFSYIKSVHVEHRIGFYDNEMNRYRYNVFLGTRISTEENNSPAVEIINWQESLAVLKNLMLQMDVKKISITSIPHPFLNENYGLINDRANLLKFIRNTVDLCYEQNWYICYDFQNLKEGTDLKINIYKDYLESISDDRPCSFDICNVTNKVSSRLRPEEKEIIQLTQNVLGNIQIYKVSNDLFCMI